MIQNCYTKLDFLAADSLSYLIIINSCMYGIIVLLTMLDSNRLNHHVRVTDWESRTVIFYVSSITTFLCYITCFKFIERINVFMTRFSVVVCGSVVGMKHVREQL